MTLGGRVAQVSPGSIADEIGIEPDDLLVSINGHPLRDVIDYQFYSAEEELVLHIRRGHRVHRIEVQRDYDEELGFTLPSRSLTAYKSASTTAPFVSSLRCPEECAAHSMCEMMTTVSPSCTAAM